MSRINHEPNLQEPEIKKRSGFRIKISNWRDKAQSFALFILVAIFLAMIIAAGLEHWRQASIGRYEYLTPNYEYGVRIPGTNYVVEGKDTLEIRKNVTVNYNYVRLSKEERIEARRRIKLLQE
ncbi:MAG: hypothetical protein ACK505_06160 [Flavobacteriales bacterium]|jgi:hypothetical protein